MISTSIYLLLMEENLSELSLTILGLRALETYLALSIVTLERAIMIAGSKYYLMKQSLSYRYLK